MSRQRFTRLAREDDSPVIRVDSRAKAVRLKATGATGFDGVSEAVAACSGRRAPDKTLDKTPTANNNFALAA
jgi:hypothetical protein